MLCTHGWQVRSEFNRNVAVAMLLSRYLIIAEISLDRRLVQPT